jgi:hypothetical protein
MDRGSQSTENRRLIFLISKSNARGFEIGRSGAPIGQGNSKAAASSGGLCDDVREFNS